MEKKTAISKIRGLYFPADEDVSFEPPFFIWKNMVNGIFAA